MAMHTRSTFTYKLYAIIDVYELAKAQLPRSLFSILASGMMLKSKMSTGRPVSVTLAYRFYSEVFTDLPIVVQELGMSTIPATWPCTGAHDSRR